jgi:hypothetical protein
MVLGADTCSHDSHGESNLCLELYDPLLPSACIAIAMFSLPTSLAVSLLALFAVHVVDSSLHNTYRLSIENEVQQL